MMNTLYKYLNPWASTGYKLSYFICEVTANEIINYIKFVQESAGLKFTVIKCPNTPTPRYDFIINDICVRQCNEFDLGKAENFFATFLSMFEEEEIKGNFC